MSPTSSAAGRALSGARPAVFWSDRPDAPAARQPVSGHLDVDLVVVGGGFTGLWTALHASEAGGRRVAVVEATRIGHGASSRNGGFCDASLTHGLANGVAHWPDEVDVLLRLGRENHGALLATLEREGIDAGVELVDELSVATEPWHLGELDDAHQLARRHGESTAVLDATATRSRVGSPTYLGALATDGLALVDPARLAWGLADRLEERGVHLFDGSPVTAIEPEGRRLRVRTTAADLWTDRVVVATNAYGGPLRRPRRYVVPVYDHVLVTEPLTGAQRAALAWSGREGVADAGNQFHYYRLTPDDRILWGGYDAVYHFGNRVDPDLDQRAATEHRLADHFLATFPDLEDVRFTHRWGGPIATTTRFTAAWGTSHDDRVAWVAGYTGLGVAASRFGAAVALDLVDGNDTERADLAMVRRPPFPFPPEPLRWAGVELTRRAIARADRNDGRRGAWLRLLDRFGIGFDS